MARSQPARQTSVKPVSTRKPFSQISRHRNPNIQSLSPISSSRGDNLTPTAGGTRATPRSTTRTLSDLANRYEEETFRERGSGGLKGNNNEKKVWRASASNYICERCRNIGLSCAMSEDHPSSVRCIPCATVNGAECSCFDLYLHWRAMKLLKISDSEWEQLVRSFSSIISDVILREEALKSLGTLNKKSATLASGNRDTSSRGESKKSKITFNNAEALPYELDSRQSASSNADSLVPTVQMLTEQINGFKKKNTELEDALKSAARNLSNEILKGKQERAADERQLLECTKKLSEAEIALRALPALREDLERTRVELKWSKMSIKEGEVTTKELLKRVEVLQKTINTFEQAALPEYVAIQRSYHHLNDAAEKFGSRSISRKVFLRNVKDFLPQLDKIARRRLVLIPDSSGLEENIGGSFSRKRSRDEKGDGEADEPLKHRSHGKIARFSDEY